MTDFNAWRTEADALLKQYYALDFNDAGFDDVYVRDAWKSGEAPDEFIERVASKYDLDPVSGGYFLTP
ncbi:hypothetical protein ACWCOP_13375 [Maricaulaceae bacterium MS644]